MDLKELKRMVAAIESDLPGRLFVPLAGLAEGAPPLTVGLTERLRKKCQKGRVWKSKQFLATLKNAKYGFDPHKARSRAGSDGIFLLDRDYRPASPMMAKLFEQYLDKETEEVAAIAAAAGAGQLLPVRVVSHHMRLLGVLARGAGGDLLVLVDYDDSK